MEQDLMKDEDFFDDDEEFDMKMDDDSLDEDLDTLVAGFEKMIHHKLLNLKQLLNSVIPNHVLNLEESFLEELEQIKDVISSESSEKTKNNDNPNQVIEPFGLNDNVNALNMNGANGFIDPFEEEFNDISNPSWSIDANNKPMQKQPDSQKDIKK